MAPSLPVPGAARARVARASRSVKYCRHWSHRCTRLIDVKFAWTPRQTCDSQPYAIVDVK
jgi:hypothetical protein